MLKGCLHQGGESFGVVCVRVLRHFSVSPRIHAPILPHKLQKDYKKFSMWLQNRDKTET